MPVVTFGSRSSPRMKLSRSCLIINHANKGQSNFCRVAASRTKRKTGKEDDTAFETEGGLGMIAKGVFSEATRTPGEWTGGGADI